MIEMYGIYRIQQHDSDTWYSLNGVRRQRCIVCCLWINMILFYCMLAEDPALLSTVKRRKVVSNFIAGLFRARPCVFSK